MNKIVGNNLKKMRKAKNMTQEEVADFLKISQSAYARMEQGQSTSWTIHFNKICKVFEVTPEELVRKEIGNEAYEKLMGKVRLTDIEMMSAYRKIIKHYELQIEDLKTIIKHLNKGKN
ncbi:helix-turn-helix domain-containing protein [Flavobacterium gelatinilyticum]|uniref:helix-turn-helix domain-containing protein n=1 Tax=Flavobacterium gelatinilyticum TaxID=3003260 RepID=UPI00248184D5|nr:helix-turn-helix transcriptional regulator [Flavobacterium gelatinilyticum]